MNPRFIPNIITIARFILVLPLLISLFSENYKIAFYIFIVAGFTDGIDGILARYFQWTSRFGAMADPLADKLLLVSSFITLAWLGKLPLWLLIVIVGRDLIIIAGATAAYYVLEQIEFNPSLISKFNTAMQVLLVFLILFELSYKQIAGEIILSMMWLVFITSLLSLINYVFVWSKRAILRD